MAPVRTGLDARQQIAQLSEEHPEWVPWLSRYGLVLDAVADPQWRQAAEMAIVRRDQEPGGPRLAGATVALDATAAGAWLRRLLPDAGPVDALALLEAVINQDHEQVEALAETADVEPDTLLVIGHLASMPLLHALQQRAGGTGQVGERTGYCPVCGAWPVLAELRGLDRSRWLRCGRCGHGWEFTPLHCPYCDNTDHRRLGSLRPEEDGEARSVDVCDVCFGYVKTLATLRPWTADLLPLIDLMTIELDLAAQEREFARPDAPAVDLGLRIVATGDADDARRSSPN